MESHYDYVLVGGGLTSVMAAQSIRDHDKTGTVAIFGDEDHPPYDRPPLSKNYLQSDDYKDDDAYSKYDDFYPKNNIELHKSTRVTDIDRAARSIMWAAGDIAWFTDIALGKTWHCEHHLNAKWQGQAVGANMAGVAKPYDRVSYFFSDEFDLHMILRGDPQGGKHSVFVGDVEGAEFVELYHNDEGRLTMGIAISHEEPKLDAISDTLERLIRAKVKVSGREQELQSSAGDLNSVLNRLG